MFWGAMPIVPADTASTIIKKIAVATIWKEFVFCGLLPKFT
jgi:hypothetical protein